MKDEKQNENERNKDLKTGRIDGDIDKSLRPQNLCDYIGQPMIKKTLSISIESAKKRKTSMDHLLFYGPPGLGKTTLAVIIANEMESRLTTVAAPSLNKPADLISALMSLQDGDVLFIDEIHRLPIIVEEFLYSAMEDFKLDISLDPETPQASSKIINIPLNHFTLVGATTKVSLLSSPLRDRFGSLYRLENYSNEDLSQIIKRDAKLLGIDITNDGLLSIATRSRGTPRIAIRLLKRILDFLVVKDLKIADKDFVEECLNELQIAENGLEVMDMKILIVMNQNFDNGPVGLETLSSAIGEDAKTIEDVCEPYLIQIGFLKKTPRGRVLTSKGIEYCQSLCNVN